MDAAWSQVGQLLEAQRRVRLGQMGVRVSQVWYARHIVPLLARDQQKGLMIVAPLQKRIVANGVTVQHALRTSVVQPTMTSTVLRRLIRPRGRVVRQLGFSARAPTFGAHGTRQRARGQRRSSAGTAGRSDHCRSRGGTHHGRWGNADVSRPDRGRSDGVSADRAPADHAGAGAAAADALVRDTRPHRSRPDHRPRPGDSGARDTPVRPLRRLPDVVKLTDVSADMVTVAAGCGQFRHHAARCGLHTRRPGPTASRPSGSRRRSATRSIWCRRARKRRRRRRAPRMDLGAVASAAAAALDPARTIPRRVMAGIFVPPRIQEEIGDGFVEPMAYPVIDAADVRAAQEPVLRAVPAEHQPDRAEQRHPARDQPAVHRVVHGRSQPRVRARAAVARVPDRPARLDVPAVLGRAELLRRPTRMPRRSGRSCATSLRCTGGRATRALGAHDNREAGTANEDELVLVIRGELLKRYPTAVIYAHRACWQRTDDGTAADRAKDPCSRSGGIDNSKERRLAPLTAEEQRRAAAEQGAHAPLRGEGRSGHLLPGVRPHGRRTRAAAQASTPTTTRAGSSSSRSGPASRDSASTPRSAAEH